LINPDNPYLEAFNLSSIPSNKSYIPWDILKRKWKHSPFMIINTKIGILDKNAVFKYCQGGEPIILVKFIGDGNTRK